MTLLQRPNALRAALLCAVLFTGATAAHAQSSGTGSASTPSSTSSTTTNPSMRTDARTDDRSDGNWGWMGLFGLAGLAGLRRRDVPVAGSTRNGTTTVR